MKGTLYSEKIINMYFKILEKMNLVQLSMDNYQRQQQMMQETPDGGARHSVSSHFLSGTNTMKIQYLNTNFVRKLRLQNPDLAVNGASDASFDLLQQTDHHLMQYFNHDLVLLPFFFDKIDTVGDQNAAVNDNHKHVFQKNGTTGEMDALCGCSDEKRAVLVSVKVLDNQVDLFDKEYREHDNHDISNCVLHVMDVASRLQNIELNEELIDADIENIQGVEHDEDMVVTMCYIAECFTFGREPDLDNIDLEFQRKHIVDVFLSLLSFS